MTPLGGVAKPRITGAVTEAALPPDPHAQPSPRGPGARAARARIRDNPRRNVEPHWPRPRKLLNRLYHGDDSGALRFQTALLIFDVALIAFFIVEPFLERGPVFLVLDYAIAAVLAVDLFARGWAHGDLSRWLMRPIVWADFAVLGSLLAPAYLANLAFLRILRGYSLVHSRSLWRVLGRGRWRDSPLQDTVKAGANLALFVFLTTSLVHSAFAARVPELRSFVDSLYFTVTSLTTTGYGDITLPGVWGRWLSILIMIVGVSLFLRLIQVVMRPAKVVYQCPNCGLMRHEVDAVHCKACGQILAIVNENE